MTLTHGSLFTGVGGFDLGFSRAGIETLWMVEWDKHCQTVLRDRFPGVPLYGNITEVDGTTLPPVDIISFGSPCQGLSAAGQRRGLEDERSNLFYEAIRIIRDVRPQIAVWENVPGAFSSAGGADFEAVLDSLADIGALDIAWRVLDSRFFGVPQRRRRIYLVADFRDERAGEILSLADGLRRFAPKNRRKGQEGDASADAGAAMCGVPDVAGPLGTPSRGGQRQDLDGMTYIPELADTLRFASDNPASHGKVNGTDRGTLIPEPVTYRKSRRAQSVEDHETWVESDEANTVNTFDVGDVRATTVIVEPEPTYWDGGQVDDTLDASMAVKGQMMPEKRRMFAVVQGWRVRRFTPRETERLQGFPDDHTLVSGMSDTQRYRQMGNAVTVNVTEYLGRAIAEALT